MSREKTAVIFGNRLGKSHETYLALVNFVNENIANKTDTKIVFQDVDQECTIRESKQLLKECKEALEAKDDLLVCYRIGKPPSDKLFDKLKRLSATRAKIKKALEG